LNDLTVLHGDLKYDDNGPLEVAGQAYLGYDVQVSFHLYGRRILICPTHDGTLAHYRDNENDNGVEVFQIYEMKHCLESSA